MPPKKKPEHLKKVGVSIGLTPAMIERIDAARGDGESRSVFVAEIVTKWLESHDKKIERKLKN